MITKNFRRTISSKCRLQEFFCFRCYVRVQGFGVGVWLVPRVRDPVGEGAADQRLSLRRHEHLQRRGAVPHHRTRHFGHRESTGRRLRVRLPSDSLLLLPKHGSYIHSKGRCPLILK